MPARKTARRPIRRRPQIKGGPIAGGRGVAALIRLATRGGNPVVGPSKRARMSSAAAGPVAMAAGRRRKK